MLLDCLDPPLTFDPKEKRYMCPLHVEYIVVCFVAFRFRFNLVHSIQFGSNVNDCYCFSPPITRTHKWKHSARESRVKPTPKQFTHILVCPNPNRKTAEFLVRSIFNV